MNDSSDKLSPSLILKTCLFNVITAKLTTSLMCLTENNSNICFKSTIEKFKFMKQYAIALITGIVSLLKTKLSSIFMGLNSTYIGYTLAIFIAFIFIYVIFTFIKFMIKNKNKKVNELKELKDSDNSDDSENSENLDNSEMTIIFE